MHIYRHDRYGMQEVTSADYEHLILGKCHGVILRRRGPTDLHVIIEVMVEDDETWHVGQSNGFSSFWLPEYIEVMKKTQAWLKAQCEKDPSGYGWVFRS